MDSELSAVVVSRDESISLQLLEYEGEDRFPTRDATGLYFTVRLSPTASKSRIAVVFSGTAVKFAAWEELGYRKVAEDRRLFYFAEAAIGEYLDTHGLPPATPSGVSAFQIECFSPMFNAWEKRTRVSDEEIEAYIGAKLFWGWKYDQAFTSYDLPDLLRLHIPFDTLKRVAEIGLDRDWKEVTSLPQSLMLAPTPDFLRARTRRSVASQSSSTGDYLIAQLQAPRYAGPREHWLKSHDFAHGPKRDLANAAKEAICAVEGLARVISGDHTKTLGDLIKTLKAARGLNPALAKMLENLWGFTSNTPGVRHGAATAVQIMEGETQFVLDTSQAALRLLLDMDT